MAVEGSMVLQNLRSVLQRINDIAAQCNPAKVPRLVAVSKTKPKDLIVACYDQGQRHFGENYFQELEEKSNQLSAICPDLKWHFIGRLQSNKLKKLCQIPNLFCVETVDSQKHCDMLEKAMLELGRSEPVNVFLQVNTSGELNKGGVTMEGAPRLAQFVAKQCPHLRLLGLMTIGSLDESANRDKNADFCALVKTRQSVGDALGCAAESLELSMGMTNDFDVAIQYGSTNVRVGSAIFGSRNYAPKTNDS